MFAKIAFMILFVGLPIWGSYEGDDLLQWAMVGIAMLILAINCLRVHNKLERRKAYGQNPGTYRGTGKKKGA